MLRLLESNTEAKIVGPIRRARHRIILGDDAELITRFPEQTGKVTVLTFEGDKVTAIRYWNPESEPIDSVLK